MLSTRYFFAKLHSYHGTGLGQKWLCEWHESILEKLSALKHLNLELSVTVNRICSQNDGACAYF